MCAPCAIALFSLFFQTKSVISFKMGVFTIKTQKPTIFHFPHMLVTELIWAAGHCILNTIFCKMTDIQVSNSLLGWSGDEFSLTEIEKND